MTTTTMPATGDRRGRLLLLLGLGLPALGMIAYVARLMAQRLDAPWYVPALATAGVGLVITSLWRRRTGWRGVALVLGVLLAGAEWAMLLSMRLPAYAGPAKVGRPFPPFAT